MSFLIRTASLDDVPFLVEFNLRLAKESEGKELDRSILENGVRRALASPELCRYYVAVEQDTVVAQTMVTYEITDWRDGIAYWIQSVYVTPSHRRKGIFSLLYRHIFDQAQKDGRVRLIRLYVEEENHGAISTYEKLGMKKAQYMFYESEVKLSPSEF